MMTEVSSERKDIEFQELREFFVDLAGLADRETYPLPAQSCHLVPTCLKQWPLTF